MPEYTNSIARPKRKANSPKPVLCTMCLEVIDGTDREIAELNRVRHMRTAHQIPPCHPDFYEE